MSDSDDDFQGPYRPDMEKVKRKMANIPTIEGLLAEKDPNKFTPEQEEKAEVMARELIEKNPQSEKEMTQCLKQLMKAHKTDCKKSLLLCGYKAQLRKGGVRHEFIESYLITKAPRSQSGVLVVTVFTSAYPEVDGKKQKFSCEWNCYYCPNEPNQPRSYLLNEPGVRRANRLDFDAVAQFNDRVRALVQIGHPADKVELLVLGGTWESYPDEYRTTFIRDLFYAANTFFDEEKREKMSLFEEQMENQRTKCKIIGVTLETRPDTINEEMLVRLRQFGCTRVQLGVQHTDDVILTVVNRQAYRDDTIRAIRLLKDSCFKVDIHLMPDLPGATPEVDKRMFDDVLYSPDLQADQWKIYPCQTTPFTLIKQWYEEGKYQPYGMDNLIDVLLYAKRRVHPWIRLNRVVRDIPIEYVLAGIEVANLRQLLGIRMKKEGKTCQCIRCREIGGDKDVAAKVRTATLVEREYEASNGKEVFLSFETPDKQTIFGFLRLRFPGREAASPFGELHDAALIRELHVYGNLAATYDPKKRSDKAQHLGFGTKLLLRAEAIAADRGYKRIAVISGIGVRSYYENRGYMLVDPERGGFLLKDIRRIQDHPLIRSIAKSRTVAALRQSNEARFRMFFIVAFVLVLLQAIMFPSS